MAASSRRWRGFTPEFGGGIRLLALAARDNGDTRSIRWRARLSHMLSADSPQTAEKPSPEHRESGHRITPMAACERRARPCCGGIPSCLGPASQVYALRIGAFATANGNFAPSANDRKVPHRRHCPAKNAAPTTNDRTGEAARKRTTDAHRQLWAVRDGRQWADGLSRSAALAPVAGVGSSFHRFSMWPGFLG